VECLSDFKMKSWKRYAGSSQRGVFAFRRL
jgi:hypothetical protein